MDRKVMSTCKSNQTCKTMKVIIAFEIMVAISIDR